jgi:hypothetical protein
MLWGEYEKDCRAGRRGGESGIILLHAPFCEEWTTTLMALGKGAIMRVCYGRVAGSLGSFCLL